MAGGVEVQENRGAGLWAERGLRPSLRELWMRGGTREGEALAVPLPPAAGPEGRLAIPDFRLGEVVIVEADGTWRGSTTRRGSGPGEVRRPVAAAWGPDSLLSVLDIAGSKVVRLRDGSEAAPDLPLDRSFTGPIVAGGELPRIFDLGPDGSLLVSRREPASGGPRENVDLEVSLLRLEAGAERPDTLIRTRVPEVSAGGIDGWPAPGWPLPMGTIGAGGRYLVGAAEGSYRLLVRDARGRPLLQVCRNADPLPLTAAERGDSVPDERFGGLAEAIRKAASPHRPASFGRLVLGAGGRIWVQRERPPAYPADLGRVLGRPGALHDVFAADGTYLGEVRMPDGEALQAAVGDTIWTFETGELGETRIRARELTLEETAEAG